MVYQHEFDIIDRNVFRDRDRSGQRRLVSRACTRAKAGERVAMGWRRSGEEPRVFAGAAANAASMRIPSSDGDSR